MYLSLFNKHTHKLAHYFSHKKTLYDDHFSLEQGSLSLLLFFSFYSCGVLWMFAHGHIYRRNKPKLSYMHEDTYHLSFMQNTKCPLQCMHHNMWYSYTTPCVHHAPCYLSSHATFHFVKCMLAMWKWLDPRI